MLRHVLGAMNVTSKTIFCGILVALALAVSVANSARRRGGGAPPKGHELRHPKTLEWQKLPVSFRIGKSVYGQAVTTKLNRPGDGLGELLRNVAATVVSSYFEATRVDYSVGIRVFDFERQDSPESRGKPARYIVRTAMGEGAREVLHPVVLKLSRTKVPGGKHEMKIVDASMADAGAAKIVHEWELERFHRQLEFLSRGDFRLGP